MIGREVLKVIPQRFTKFFTKPHKVFYEIAEHSELLSSPLEGLGVRENIGRII
jgi:hypothetical protein